ncbi:MFS transporter [Microbacterium sp. NEAU-LLC]|uniref:MFS transporter n=1 Tax=Microbacterium helvum TaxID=2773713 RepID=A0ABR8NQ11_9MICO|nr:MFS transporter [Microbacterium helvum]MBD3942738.1 MFS transporter [Microbacterium helvum]
MAETITSDTAAQGAAPSEFRRGWPTVVFGAVGAGVGLSSLGYILGTMVVPLQEEFGWGRGEINLASLVSSLGLAAALPFVGRFLDRFGVKRVSMISIPLFVVVLVMLSVFTSSLATFLAFYALAGVLGAGTSAVTYSKAVIDAFDRRRGIALGIVAGGLGAAGLVLPPLMGTVIAADGWRAAYLTMALLGALPFVLLFFARLSAPASVAAVDRSTLPGLSVPEALRTRAFWSLCIVFFLLGWALLTMVPHFVPLLIDSGVDPVRAAFLSSLVGVGTVIARPVIGWLFDRFYATYVAVPLFLAAALGCLLLLWAGPAVAPLTALLIGIGFGAEIDLMGYLSSRYLGPRAFGILYSIVYSVFMIGSAFGPVVAGFTFDATGSYSIPLVVAASMMVVAAVILLTLPRFTKEAAA